MKKRLFDLNHTATPNQSLRFGSVRIAAASIFATLAFVAIALASDPPWKGKPYDQWTDKDLEKIFTDSPWARIATVTRTWAPLTSKEGAASDPAGGAQPNSPMPGGRPGGPGGGTAPSGAGGSPSGDELRFNVYWASSRTMRAASARKSVLHGEKDLDVAKYANEPQEEYQVVVQSEDMAPFVRHDESFYQANSFLDVKKTKQKISPSHVRYERDEKGLVGAAVFFFPKKTASGELTLPSDEKNVEFNCKIEGSRLRVNFDPQKMLDSQGPSL